MTACRGFPRHLQSMPTCSRVTGDNVLQEQPLQMHTPCSTKTSSPRATTTHLQPVPDDLLPVVGTCLQVRCALWRRAERGHHDLGAAPAGGQVDVGHVVVLTAVATQAAACMGVPVRCKVPDLLTNRLGPRSLKGCLVCVRRLQTDRDNSGSLVSVKHGVGIRVRMAGRPRYSVPAALAWHAL